MSQYLPKSSCSQVRCVVRYPNCRATEIRCSMGLRSTVPGANNRLDMEALFTYDRETDRATALDGNASVASQGHGAQQAAHGDNSASTNQTQLSDMHASVSGNQQQAGIMHKRGLSPCVFVPWEQVRDKAAAITYRSATPLPLHACDAATPCI
jgi:F-box protein 9